MTHQTPPRGPRLTAPASALLAALALLALPQAARAQWQTSGNNNTTTNNVGVGTSAPQAKLDVAGGPAVVDSNQYFGFRLANNDVRRLIGAAANGTGQHFIDVGQATGYLTGIRFWPRDNISSPDVVISGSGYLGVGTGAAAPIGQLQVRRDHGNTTFQNGTDFQVFLQNMDTAANNTVGFAFGGQRADGTSRLAGSVFSQMTSHANGSFASDLVFNVTGAGEAPLEGLRIKSSGYVGVGTPSPGARLHVGGQADNLFQVVSTGSAATDTVAHFSSAVGGIMMVRGNGNVGIGTAAPTERLHVEGNINVTGNISAKFQDVAEWVPSLQKLSAGTVVVLDPGHANHVLASTSAYDTKVAGVVSAQPGVILGEAGEGKLMVATTGRVKVRVDARRGPIRVGDLLVTGGAEGVAMKSVPLDLGGTPIHRPGTIIGKALEPLDKGVGEILVLLSLQ